MAGSHRLSFPFFTAESFLSDLDAEQRDRFLSDLRAAKEASKSGVSVGRAKAAVTVWEIWQNYCADLGIDPFLETIQDKVPILQVFAQRVRTGELAAGGHPILARSVEDYVRHVAQTFLGVGANDPRKKPGEKDIDFRIQRLQAAWKKKDPPPNRVNRGEQTRGVTSGARQEFCRNFFTMAKIGHRQFGVRNSPLLQLILCHLYL